LKYQDKKIVEEIRSGNDSVAVNQLYKDILPKAKRSLQRKGCSEEDFKDAFQDAVLVFFDQVIQRKYNEDIAIAAFLISVSHKKWVSKLRKQNKEFNNEEQLEMAGSDSLLDAVVDEERKRLIYEILDAVGSKCRMLLEKLIFFNYSMKEVSEELGYSNENSAKTQNYKCRKKLIEKFKENTYIRDLLEFD
jgi:RNA polymerase sigma factor (sigma-70 family)